MSIKKQYPKKGSDCKVTFNFNHDVENIKTVRVLGDFNHWDKNCEPMKRTKDKGFSQSVNLPKGQSFQFRYLINDSVWENDPESDQLVPNGINPADFNSMILV